MPHINIKCVYNFSSEDPLHPASNFLNPPSAAKKWKCELSGEKSAYVILQLEKPSTINAIDIGNAHSAYVEVLVAKSCSSEYKQILLTSSFMTPIESRNSDPVNRVRCFGKSALDETVSKYKWEFVKILCSQPYNKHVQYGLSFIKLHSPVDAKEDHDSSSMPLMSFGNFKIREDSPDSESESSQSLFARWKVSHNSSASKDASMTPLSAAAAIRHASTPISLKNQTFQINRTKITPKERKNNQQNDDDAINNKNRNRSQLMYEDEDDEPNEKLDKIIHKEKERIEREKLEKKNTERKGKQDKNGSKNPASSSSAITSKLVTKDRPIVNEEKKLVKQVDNPVASTSRSKRQSSPILLHIPHVKRTKEDKERVYKPFNKLLEGVVLVISGIQNPVRATIRQQAMDMGAKYKPDWEATCTHLICAFKNTPKYNQVHGHGKIITKDWISECHSKKMRLPWRRFALDSDDGDGSESEDEIYDISSKPAQLSNQKSSDLINHKMSAASPKKSSRDRSRSLSTTPSKNRKSPKKSQRVLSSDDESLDRYNLSSSRTERNEFVSSGSDTEDEIRRVLEKKSVAISPKVVCKDSSSDDIYNVTTEEEDKQANTENQKSETLTPLPEFFKGKRFYVSTNVSSTDEIKLKRFIDIYGGELTKIASDSDYIISNSSKHTPYAYKGEVVKPLWIFECNDLEMLLPTKRYNFSDW